MPQPNPNSSPEGSARGEAKWLDPANDMTAAEPAQNVGTKNPAIAEHLDPKEIRSAAPADGTGVTGTVRPA
jgi:hypothetical protein